MGDERPNILFCISDDQSWPHAGAYGSPEVKTPNFDTIAKNGALFHHCFAPSPSCAPTRASILTGRNIWQNQEAGVHGSLFPAKFPVFTHLLEAGGYEVAYTGKGWGPGRWNAGGKNVARKRNPIGKRLTGKPGHYAKAFKKFMSQHNRDQPFFFWFGSTDPHRPYSNEAVDKGLQDREFKMPGFLPDGLPIRKDLAGYSYEIERFDRELGEFIQILKDAGEYENTLIIVTSDNGMPFPRAKMHCYELGTHVPFAVQWPKQMPGNRTINDLISLVDLAPTFLDVAQLRRPSGLTGSSMLKILMSDQEGQVDASRVYVLTGKERHDPARQYNECYPIRTIRTHQYLYLRNFKPDRWPSGDPPSCLDLSWSDHLTRQYFDTLPENEGLKPYYDRAVNKRPLEEVYDIRKDPYCLHNLAGLPEYKEVCESLWAKLQEKLKEQKDPRVMGKGDCFETVPCFIPNKGSFSPPRVRDRFDHSQDKPWTYTTPQNRRDD
ncbi:sulfatase [Verrucomicrobiaceae bacterium N1E253]|uniref:Sulfatase n=1 Tax=Oceaniferula marina TaxID=2748318 RepID=A0A851GFU6_9BACT|nr:sulfatase [Oceaniferula marina]NWK56648.1 sulfatase [Oceaniferula marina]